MQPCPSDFTLDDLEIHGGVAPPEIAAHLASCPRCGARRTARVARQAEFRAEMAPVVWPAIESRTARLRRRWLVFGLPALAAAAAIVIVAGTGREQRGYVGVKGGPSVEIVCRRGAQTFVLDPGQPLAPGDELRFRPLGSPAAARYLLLGSVDGGGRYTPFYPARAAEESVPLPPPGEPLPGGIRIDDAPGPERLLGIWSPHPITAAAAAPVAEAEAARLGPIRALAGVEVTSAWLVLSKVKR